MSWGYESQVKDFLENSTYCGEGSVNIEVKEYRSLVEQIAELRRIADKEHEDWYAEYGRANKCESKVKELESQINKLKLYKEWVKFDATLADRFKTWNRIQALENDEEENEEDV